MPFKEITYSEDLSNLIAEPENNGLMKSMLLNQSPIIKLWAVVMVVNLLMMVFFL